MKDKINNVLKFDDFEKNWKPEESKKTKRTDVAKDILKEKYDVEDLENLLEDDPNIIVRYNKDDVPHQSGAYLQDGMPGERDRNNHPIPAVDPHFSAFNRNKFDKLDLDDDDLEDDDLEDDLEYDNDDLDDLEDDLEYDNDELDELESDDDILAEPINEDEPIQTFESFKLKDAPKKEKQPEYTMLGKEKEPKSNPNFGIGAVKAQEIKKITDFNLIDPPTPKERSIGGSAGVFIDNDKVKGFINRIEGKDVYIESSDEPMVIKKFNIKDVVKTKKEK